MRRRSPRARASAESEASPRHCRVGSVDPPAVDVVSKIFTSARTIAVVGLSPDPRRPSHGVARYLQRVGYRIIPVNPHVSEVLGERAFPSLRDVKEPVDVVDVFRRSEFVGPIVDEAIAIRLPRSGCRMAWSTKRRPSGLGRQASMSSWTTA